MQQLRHYLRIMRRWFWLIMLGIIVCSGATFGISKYIIKPVYQTTSLIQVNGPLTVSNTSSGSDVFSDQALAVAYSLLITSTDVLQEVSKEIPGETLTQLQSTVSASPQAGTQIIEVHAQADNPQLAAKIANTVVNVFIHLQVGAVLNPLKNQEAQNLLKTKTEIDQAQAQLIKLQQSGAATSTITNESNILATDRANYNSLLANQQKIQAQEDQVTRALNVAQVAIPPDQASSPRVVLNTIVAAALGLLLMMVLVLLIDWFDTTIQTSEDVAKLTHLEPLGCVPSSQYPLLLPTLTNISRTSDMKVEQAFVVMSTGLNTFINSQCTVLVTSLQANAGVTNTAVNLALTFAQLGKRVLLIDANVHRPSLQNIFPSSNTRGLLDSLVDIYQLQGEIVQSWLNLWQTNIPNLWLLPLGAKTNDVPIIKQLQGMRMLLDWLLPKKENISSGIASNVVDIIILDTPALSEGTDTLALASVVSNSIIVVEAGKEGSEVVNKAGITLQQLGSTVLGVIINRQTMKHRPYFYGDGQSHKTLSSIYSLGEVIPSSSSTESSLSLDIPSSQSLRQLNKQNSLIGQTPLPLEENVPVFKRMTIPTRASLERLNTHQNPDAKPF